MKSERRHELGTNELAQWLANLPKFIENNRKTIIYIAVLIVIIAVYSVYYYTRSDISQADKINATALFEQLNISKARSAQSLTQGIDTSDTILLTGQSLEQISTQTSDTKLAALALIKQAEALRSELHYRKTDPEAQTIEFQISRAEDLYSQAILNAAESPTIKAMANFGLALCAEELGNFQKAEQIYNDIIAEPAFAGTVFPQKAKFRLVSLADYQKQPKFVQTAPPPKSPVPVTNDTNTLPIAVPDEPIQPDTNNN